MVRDDKVLIWTRSIEDWTSDRTLPPFMNPAYNAVHVPCIAVQGLNFTASVEPADYVVFTSANAVSFSMRVPELALVTKSAASVYTHGEATAAALESFGIKATKIEVRTAEELSNWLVQHLPANAHISIPGADEPAWPMAPSLAKHGFNAKSYSVYQTSAVARDHTGRLWTSADIKSLTDYWCGVIAFASPSAVRGFASVFKPGDNRLGKKLVAVAIGPTTRDTAAVHFQRVETAAVNSVASLAEKAMEIYAS
ncbi:MAG: hypothetical protein RL011_323 [Pseudomonadota bacterium]